MAVKEEEEAISPAGRIITMTLKQATNNGTGALSAANGVGIDDVRFIPPI